MSALGDHLLTKKNGLGNRHTPYDYGYDDALDLAANLADRFRFDALVEAAQLRGPFAAAVLRAAAERLRNTVPENVFTADVTTVDAHSARVQRFDADLLHYWASEAEQ